MKQIINRIMPIVWRIMPIVLAVLTSIAITMVIQNLELSTSAMVTIQFGILVFLIMVIVVAEFNRQRINHESYTSTTLPQDLSTRIRILTMALEESGKVINAIETEIESRKELVTKLETQKAVAERAITLSREQVDAVSALLSDQVSRQSKKDFRIELVKDIAIFVSGIVITLLINR